MPKIELLAPAKDLECGIAAVNCGADAVYIGAPRFGARSAAGNDLSEIAKLTDYAHKYWTKTYTTLNTILHDDEIPAALDIISQLYEIGVDGLIIQDVGLLECDLPPIPIIASTQMHNNTPEKVRFLEQIGVKRVILARELSLDEIKAIRAASNVELEFFVHGALCVCYSGRCYLSYAMGGRSGNRGQCAQPCRKPYSLIDCRDKAIVSDKHLLSLRDLNLSEHLAELIKAGICSFKIEGRLKDKAYVSNVVSYYRAKLDSVIDKIGLQKSSSGASCIDFTADINKTFNRGYTTYFLHGRDADMGSIETPKMIGEPVGKVASLNAKSATVDTNTSMHNGDGICFFDRAGELRGTTVNEVRGRTIVPDKFDGIEKGTLIYRNHDHEFITKLEKANPQRLIGVSLTLGETPDGLELTARDEDGVEATFSLPCDKIPAEKPDLATANIKKQLLKFGGTNFVCSDVVLHLSGIYFVPISVINALRRGVLEELATRRDANRPVAMGKIVENDIPYPENYLSYMGNVLNSRARDFYRRHMVGAIEPAAESGLDMRRRKVMTTRYCIKRQIGLCGKTIAEPLSLVDSGGIRLTLKFDCEKCEMTVIYGDKK
ncbi:MAG: U32 family peptidase [Armatimonadota bacterium]|nr:U32 family peptidase [bacterium]